MPAVQLERLKNQIDDLLGFYSGPSEFHAKLVRLLEQYADLTFRPGRVGKTVPAAIESFHVSTIVLQQIERALRLTVSENPLPALALADELWGDARLEPRLIAASLMGMLPAAQREQALTRIIAWAQPETEKVFLAALFDQGSASLRQFALQAWIDLIASWLNSNEAARQRLGVLAVLPIIQDKSFDNLPAVFRIITPAVRSHAELYKAELRDALVALSRRSPTETAFFLRQMLSLSGDAELAKVLRYCLPDFSEETRARLRPVLQALSK